MSAPPRFPLWPLLATLGVQTFATMAAYAIPAVAPEVAPHLGIPPTWIGFFVSIVYGVGVVSALGSPALIHSHGATRVSQGVLVATLAMIAVAALGNVWAVAIGAALMGLAYGATAPASTHLLVPLTPPERMNVVLSLRQIGVPLGGVLAGLTMPHLTHAFGWQQALLLGMIPCLLLLLALEPLRPRWDGARPRSDAAGAIARPRLDARRLVRDNPAIGRLLGTVFVFSGLQLCFVAFMTTHMTTVVGLDLVAAGQMLAAYQISGVVSRPIWGWIADRVIPARWLLVLQGVVMCGAAGVAGHLTNATSFPLVVAIAIVAGATASGYTGIAYAEFARLGGSRRTEATGLGAASMFAGVLVLPSLMSIAVLKSGSFELAYTSIGILALLAGLLLAMPVRQPRTPTRLPTGGPAS